MNQELECPTLSHHSFDSEVAEYWFVLHIHPRHEFKIFQNLTAMGLQAYCPYVIQLRQWSDRKKKIKVPLLPSMILVKLPFHKRAIVFNCNGVKRFMFYNNKIVTIPQREIDILKQSVEGKQCLNYSISCLKVGDQIKLDKFENSLAEIIKISSNRIWVRLQSINLKISIDL